MNISGAPRGNKIYSLPELSVEHSMAPIMDIGGCPREHEADRKCTNAWRCVSVVRRKKTRQLPTCNCRQHVDWLAAALQFDGACFCKSSWSRCGLGPMSYNSQIYPIFAIRAPASSQGPPTLNATIHRRGHIHRGESQTQSCSLHLHTNFLHFLRWATAFLV